MAEEIPVYLFTGFMDSGKTSLIKDTIFENDFANGARMVMWSMIWIS
jgi:putative membrane protein